MAPIILSNLALRIYFPSFPKLLAVTLSVYFGFQVHYLWKKWPCHSRKHCDFWLHYFFCFSDDAFHTAMCFLPPAFAFALLYSICSHVRFIILPNDRFELDILLSVPSPIISSPSRFIPYHPYRLPHPAHRTNCIGFIVCLYLVLY